MHNLRRWDQSKNISFQTQFSRLEIEADDQGGWCAELPHPGNQSFAQVMNESMQSIITTTKNGLYLEHVQIVSVGRHVIKTPPKKSTLF